MSSTLATKHNETLDSEARSGEDVDQRPSKRAKLSPAVHDRPGLAESATVEPLDDMDSEEDEGNDDVAQDPLRAKDLYLDTVRDAQLQTTSKMRISSFFIDQAFGAGF